MAGWNEIRNKMAAQDPNYAAAWGTFNPNTPETISPQLLEYIRGGGYNVSPDKKYQLSANYGDTGALQGYGLYDAVNAAAGVPFWTYDQTGKFTGTKAGSDADDPMMAAIPLAAAIGMGMFLPGAAGAGAASGGVAGAGGIVDATAAGYGGLNAASAATMGGGASVAGGAALPAAGATAAMGAGSSVMDLLKTGATKVMGAGAGGGDSWWESLIGPGLSAAAGVYGSNQAGKAADAQIAAAREAQATLKPWTDAGGWAVGQAANMLGKNGAEAAKNAFTMDPGYQFRLDQGNKALERAAAARGLSASGKYLKDAMAYNQGQASQEFTNSYNRLTNLAGLGQTSANSSADYGTQAGNAAAAGRVGSANALTNALSQGYSMYANSQQQNANNNILAQVLGRRY